MANQSTCWPEDDQQQREGAVLSVIDERREATDAVERLAKTLNKGPRSREFAHRKNLIHTLTQLQVWRWRERTNAPAAAYVCTLPPLLPMGMAKVIFSLFLIFFLLFWITAWYKFSLLLSFVRFFPKLKSTSAAGARESPRTSRVWATSMWAHNEMNRNGNIYRRQVNYYENRQILQRKGKKLWSPSKETIWVAAATGGGRR